MHSYQPHRVPFFQADVHALGGLLDEPFHPVLDAAAPCSLPMGGGFATAPAEAFNFQIAVSYSSPCALVSERQNGREQAGRLIDRYDAQNDEGAYPWVLHRHGWMNAAPRTSGQGGEPDRRKPTPAKTSGGPGKKPETSGGGGAPDRRAKPVPPKAGTAKRPRTSGGGGAPDR